MPQPSQDGRVLQRHGRRRGYAGRQHRDPRARDSDARRGHGVIWFDFKALCGGPRSQNDYLELARGYHTVLLSAIPRMSASMSSEARRFTWLVDIFYDHKVKLIATADCGPDGLYTQGTQASEFFRTASRLTEMRSREYLGLPHLS
jgi:cell division protein ZapE